MRTYRQLTECQRYQIQSLLKEGFTNSAIAKHLGVHRSTISRELKRNRNDCGHYRARDAHEYCLIRHLYKPKNLKVLGKARRLIRAYIRRDLSPEQIVAVLSEGHDIDICHETIYRFVLWDKLNGGTLHRHLRQRFKRNKKRYGVNNRRGYIRDRVSIDQRPGVVEKKSRIGDWEIDTVVGKNHKGAIITIVERKTKFVVTKHIAQRTANRVAGAVVALLRPYAHSVKTIICDNGKEFSEHKRIAKGLDCKVYFAHPYQSWQRGLNENTNGLLRQYFPKGMDFRIISVKQIKHATDRLNNRPRNNLNWCTPNELFLGIPFQYISKYNR